MRRDVRVSRPHPIWFVLWCLGWIGVAALSLMPEAVIPDVGGDKVAHMLAYGTMAAAAVTFCRCPARLALLALVTLFLGGTMEIAQTYVPGRQLDGADVVANGVGAVLGYLVALMVLLVLRRPLQDSPSPG